MRFVGIDPGASAIHCVVLDDARRVVDGLVLPADESTELVSITAGATAVAIDAPAALSTAPHADDLSLSPKFRPARCCEIALGRQHRLWVPWVTPQAGGAVPGWMQVGFRLYQELAANGHAAIEVYPHAGFRLLVGGILPKKTTMAGVRERVGVLERQGVAAPWMHLWSHDALDASLAALLALRAAQGTATPVGCGHDGSAIWIPEAANV
jgi:predicted nuclease with RNAse H fold